MYQPVPSKVDFTEQELAILAFWEESKAFDTLVELNRQGPRWSFIDGPITANNPMGVHHAWGRTYKDIFQRYRAMRGYQQRFQNGFDCQGLWVEVEVEKELGFNSKREIEAYGLERFAERCRERVVRYADLITSQSKRLGMWMDWEHSYYTFSDTNIEHIWHFLKACHQQGWLYKGTRSMPWCIRCGTSLSQHELTGTDSYRDLTHTSIYLRLPIIGREGEYFLVWTTTPWTLPANVALAVHPDLDYARVRQGDAVYIVGAGAMGFLEGPYERLGTVKGRDLVGLTYVGPFDDLPAQHGVVHRVIPWADVGETEGTGIVHIAPGCGAEDFELSKAENLAVIVPIDGDGDYLPGFGALSGQNVRATNPAIFASLQEKGLVYKIHDYTHSYPCCWRCGTELVFRLAHEWFISVDEIRPRLIAAARTVIWHPPSAGKRMEDWLNNMGDWCISRKRYWGLPLPFYPCPACNELTVIGSRAELVEQATAGLDQLRELHRPWIDNVTIACPRCGGEVRRIEEVGDAWLDAGIVPFSTLQYMTNRDYWRQWYPADFITEMREQIRLWFYSMLFMSVTLEDRAPYREVLAFEKLMDEHGRPMHRSLGNAIWFDEAAEKMGVDVMRWLYAGQNITANLLFGYGPAREIREHLLRLWNVYGFFTLYASLERFDPAAEPAPPARSRPLLDRWLLSRLHRLIGTFRSALDQYDVATCVHAAEGFFDELSNWYVRRSRRRFWNTSGGAVDRAAFHTLYEALVTITRLLAPIIPFMTEAMYQNLVRSVNEQAPRSVHHTRYPEADPSLVDDEVEQLMERARLLASLGHAARKSAEVRVRQPLARLLTTAAPLPEELTDEVADELNVKQVVYHADLGEAVRVVARGNPRLLGPRLGRAVQEVLAALREGRFSVRPDGSVEAAGHLLAREEVELATVATGGFATAEGDGVVVALDTTLTPELRREGLAREVVRRIQEMRKEAGLEVADRIDLCWEAEGELAEAIEAQAAAIASETLALGLRRGPAAGSDWTRWSGEEDMAELRSLRLALRRATVRGVESS